MITLLHSSRRACLEKRMTKERRWCVKTEAVWTGCDDKPYISECFTAEDDHVKRFEVHGNECRVCEYGAIVAPVPNTQIPAFIEGRNRLITAKVQTERTPFR
jgi:hypothetical protein